MDYKAFDKKMAKKYSIDPKVSTYIRACCHDKKFSLPQMIAYLSQRMDRQFKSVESFIARIKVQQDFQKKLIMERDLRMTISGIKFRASVQEFLKSIDNTVYTEITRPT